MPDAFDPPTSDLVSKILLEAQVDTIKALTGESHFGTCIKMLPAPSLKSSINVISHYAAMGYIAMANEMGHLGGIVSWDHPTAGNDILEWKQGNRTFKFRRTNDENEMPGRSGHIRKSERHNAQQAFLFEPEIQSVKDGEVHWLICSGFQDGPSIERTLESRFFVWTAPFLANEHRMIGERQILFAGQASSLLDSSSTKAEGVEIIKSPLSQKDKQAAIEEAIKKASGS
jgi:hypothetical protein